MKNHILLIAISLCSGLYLPVKSQMCAPSTSQSVLDINNVSALMLNGGDMWWDFSSSKYEVPKGSGKTAFFAHALWLAATDGDGTIHSAAQRYRNQGNDFWPGPVFEDSNGIQSTECQEFDRHWSITKEEIEGFIDGTINPTPEAIANWPAKGNPNFSMELNQDLAPLHDVNNDGLYNSDSGDYPSIKGDQAIYWIMNDIGNIHTESFGYPLGVELHVMAYAYQTNDVVNNTTFYDYTILNKSIYDYADFRLGFFTDSDLGNAQDDFIGCDSTRNLGYTYNGDPNDEDAGGNLGYGLELPIAGLRMVNLPRDADGNEIGMSRFGYFNNTSGPTGGPTISADYLNYLSGKWKDGSKWTTGGFGLGGTTPVNYVFPGNPSDSSNWSECSANNAPGDRRMIASYGPIGFSAGQGIGFTESAIFSQKEEYEGGCVDVTPFLAETDIVSDFGQNSKCENFDISIDAKVTNTDGNDGVIDLDVSGSAGILDYDWSNGSETKDLDNLSSGAYTVTVSNHLGCQEIASFNVSPVGISEIEPLEVRLSPNPSLDGLFSVHSGEDGIEFMTFNLLGTVVNQQVSNSNLDLSQLDSGVYIVRATSNAQSISQKVVIAR